MPEVLSARLERKKIVRPKQAAEMRGQSVDSVKRHLAGKEIQLGPRTIGYRIEDVLELPPEDAA
jgi:hypothetical protein